LGPLGGGWLVSEVGWRAIFVVHLPVAILGAVGTARLRESDRQQSGSLDVPGVATAGVGLALLCFGFVELGRADRRLPLVLGSLVLSGLLLTLFVHFTRQAAAPVLDLALFRSRSYRALMLASLMYNATIAGGAFLLSLLFQQARGFSAAATGLILLAATIGMPLGGQTMGRLASAGVVSRAMGLAVGVLALAYVVIAMFALDPLVWIVLPLLLTGFTAGLLYSGDTLAVLGAVAPDKAASGLAALSLVRQVGAVIGIAVLGSLSSMLQQANLVDVGVRAGLLAAGLAVAPCVVLLLRHVNTAQPPAS
jgi:DHA2 family methylenomycin A resistance protein-like MFS transporter